MVKMFEGSHLLLSTLSLLVQLSELLGETLFSALMGVQRLFKLHLQLSQFRAKASRFILELYKNMLHVQKRNVTGAGVMLSRLYLALLLFEQRCPLQVFLLHMCCGQVLPQGC